MLIFSSSGGNSANVLFKCNQKWWRLWSCSDLRFVQHTEEFAVCSGEVLLPLPLGTICQSTI